MKAVSKHPLAHIPDMEKPKAPSEMSPAATRSSETKKEGPKTDWKEVSPAGSRVSSQYADVPGPDADSGFLAGIEKEIQRIQHKGALVVIACEPSLEGVLAAVGLGYLAHADAERLRLARLDSCQPMIGEEVVTLETRMGIDAPNNDLVELAQRVLRGYRRAVSDGCSRARQGDCPWNCEGHCVRRLALAAASDSVLMPETIHRYLRLAFKLHSQVIGLHQDERVANLEALACFVSNECEHTRQFVRFSHYADGSFGAIFKPRANTIPLCANYFARRMGTEKFFLADPSHEVAALHVPNRRCAIVRLDPEAASELTGHALADDEQLVRTMWKRFYDALELEGRDKTQRGYDLRASWMPKRFWGGLTELDPRLGHPGS